jgi:hypothetical protein
VNVRGDRCHDIGTTHPLVDHAAWVAWIERCVRAWHDAGDCSSAARVRATLEANRDADACEVCRRHDPMVGRELNVHIGEGYWLKFTVEGRLPGGTYLLATPLGQERVVTKAWLQAETGEA